MNYSGTTARLEPVGSAEIPVAVDAAATSWMTGGDAPWSGMNFGVALDGIDLATSGPIADGQASWMETQVQGPGSVSFWCKLSSQSGDDLRFSVDGVLKFQSSGDGGWNPILQTLSSGPHTLRWEYAKDASGRSGLDAAWVDNLSVEPASPPAINNALDVALTWEVLSFTSSVVQPLQSIPMGGGLWSSQSAWVHDGDDAAQSGGIADVQQSHLQTKVQGPGAFSFWWKVEVLPISGPVVI